MRPRASLVKALPVLLACGALFGGGVGGGLVGLVFGEPGDACLFVLVQLPIIRIRGEGGGGALGVTTLIGDMRVRCARQDQ